MAFTFQRLWAWLQHRPKHPVLTKNRACFANFAQDRPIEDYQFVVVDTELTGLNPRRDEILSIGAVRIKDMRIVAGDNFYTCVKPNRAIPKETTLIHRITSERIRTAPSLESALPAFVEYCGDALLVGHFAHLDLGFINKACFRIMGGVVCNPCLDSARLAEAYWQNRQRNDPSRRGEKISYNLWLLAHKWGLPLFVEHDALEDALQTAYLFLFVAARLQECGLTTFRDFHRAGRARSR
jgi:DNA polymerase-3 subunit epsilon